MTEPLRALDQTTAGEANALWTARLILFVRVIAAVSMAKGLYHWALVCGVGDTIDSTFELAPLSWKAATIFFAVIDPVAAVGLWLAAAWGGVVWLTAAISMMAVELFFPQVFGGRVVVIAAEAAAIAAYLTLTVMAARERGA
ncbi:MAG: hypothetical protein IRZ09_10700 [Variibacter sp.]|nr:hypothetical protein [Variibacter sp.]